MTKISGLYSSNHTVYRRTGKQSDKSKHGDVKHIRYRDGKPVLTEIIKVNREELERDCTKDRSKPRRIRAAGNERKERRPSPVVLESKRKKLSERLKKAIQNSQTLWSERERIWISYQGSQGFLVKLFDDANREVSSKIMTRDQILDSPIPGLLDTGWKVV